MAVNLEIRQAVYLGGWLTGLGSHPISIVHSLPEALYIWALFLFTIPVFSLAFAILGLTFFLVASLPVTAALLVACVGIGHINGH